MAPQVRTDPVPPFPERFNLCSYYLDRNLEEGRAEKICLIADEGELTYGQLSERVRRLAAVLRRLGVRPEERVLIVLPDVLEFPEAFFAILRVGAVFAMINPLLKRQEIAHYLEYTKARVVLTSYESLPELGPAAEEARWCETVLVRRAGGADLGRKGAAWEELRADELPTSSLAEVEPTGPDDLAGWLFTSGSTGRPKACVHRQADFAWNTETYALKVVGYSEQDRCVAAPKLFFGYATGTNLMFPFRVGASSILFSERATPEAVFDRIEAHAPTLLTGVPTLFRAMLDSPRASSADVSSLRVCLSAGEALPPSLYREWREKTGVEILDGIGSAEMFHIYISNRLGEVKPGSLGRVVPGYEVRIVDEEGGEVPCGDPGRLRVRGGSTALCYWAHREASVETFQGDWCTSADIFRCDAEGYYYYEGRMDDLLKVSGIWTSPLEIENVLLEHPAIREVCVVGHVGQDELVKPLAFCVLEEGRSGTDTLAAELKDWVKSRLAPHKYPRWFVWRDSLPRNDRGKVARRVLMAMLEKGEVHP